MKFILLAKMTAKRIFDHFGYSLEGIPKGVRLKILRINYNWLVHFLYLKELYDQISDIEGDIVECGVGYGHSFFKLCCLSHLENKDRKIYGFDSFEGFPEPSEEDDSPRNPKRGEWNVATIETIEKLLTKEGRIETSFIKRNVTMVKGFFEESLHQYHGNGIAFLHLDVDLYQSYKVTLEYLWPKVVKGGIVLFDEYKQYHASQRFPGASKAIDEFFGSVKNQIRFNKQADRYYIVKQ